MKKNNFYLVLLILLTACSQETEKPKKSEPTNTPGTTETVIEKPVRKGPRYLETDLAQFRLGDIIFQTSFGKQSDLVSIATQSPFSHCGIILVDQAGGKKVFEANGNVRVTPLKEWIDSGKDSTFIVMRILNSEKYFGKENMKKIKETKDFFLNKNYDSKFLWNDSEIYCSELVWKSYKKAFNIELCSLRKLKDYELLDEAVKAELKERYGDAIPWDETMVAPSDIAASDALKMIYSNY